MNGSGRSGAPDCLEKDRERLNNKMIKKKIYGLAFGLCLLLLWQGLAMAIDASYILPSPVQVLDHLAENLPELMLVHFPMTMRVVCIGMLISIFLGLFLAVLMNLSLPLEKAIYPLLVFSQTIPIICLAPIFVLWLGYTEKMRVFLVVLMSFFSVTVNVFDGFKAVKKENRELLITYGAGRWKQLFYLQAPTALPYFFTSLKVGIPWAIVAASVAEWFGAPGGLGNYSRIRMMSLDAAGLLAPLVIISVTALVFMAMIRGLERLILTWIR